MPLFRLGTRDPAGSVDDRGSRVDDNESTLIVVPGMPLHLLGLAIVPWSLAAARGGVRNARSREINAAIWAFALTRSSVRRLPASNGGCDWVVVACALATPSALVFHLPSVPDVVPDDLV